MAYLAILVLVSAIADSAESGLEPMAKKANALEQLACDAKEAARRALEKELQVEIDERFATRMSLLDQAEKNLRVPQELVTPIAKFRDRFEEAQKDFAIQEEKIKQAEEVLKYLRASTKDHEDLLDAFSRHVRDSFGNDEFVQDPGSFLRKAKSEAHASQVSSKREATKKFKEALVGIDNSDEQMYYEPTRYRKRESIEFERRVFRNGGFKGTHAIAIEPDHRFGFTVRITVPLSGAPLSVFVRPTTTFRGHEIEEGKKRTQLFLVLGRNKEMKFIMEDIRSDKAFMARVQLPERDGGCGKLVLRYPNYAVSNKSQNAEDGKPARTPAGKSLKKRGSQIGG